MQQVDAEPAGGSQPIWLITAHRDVTREERHEGAREEAKGEPARRR